MLIDRKHPLATQPSRAWRWTALPICAVMLAVATCLMGMSPAAAQKDPGEPEAKPTVLEEDAVADEAAKVIDAGADSAQQPLEAETPTTPPQPALPPPAPPTLLQSSGIVVRTCLVKVIDEVTVAAQTEGQLVQVVAKEGLAVKRGDRLARLDEKQAILQCKAARVEMEDVRADELSVQQAELELQRASEESKRIEEMFKRSAASNHELSEARYAVEAAKLQVELSGKKAAAGRSIREAALRAAEEALQRCSLASPIDGVVVQTHHKAGEWVKPGDPICRIVRLNRLALEGYLAVTRCHPREVMGREVVIAVRSARNKVERAKGTVVFASPEIFRGGRFVFRAEFDNRQKDGHWVILPGLTAEVAIQSPEE